MKIHITSTGVEGLLLSSGTFVPLHAFDVALNVQDLTIRTRYSKANLDSFSLEDKMEFYDYVICRWMAAKEACLREKWDTVSQHC